MWMFFAVTAWAGSLVINGVTVDPAELKGERIEGADVLIDDRGVMFITAPDYQLPTVSEVIPLGEMQEIEAPVAEARPAPVAAGRWWLVTQDNGSTGHAVEVWLNDQRVATYASGESPQIMDLANHLVPGENTVTLRSRSSNAGGGMLWVHVGKGGVKNGAVHMDQPLDVQFGLAASREGSYERSYRLFVDVVP